MLARSLVVSFALVILVGCKTPTDLGMECPMVKRNPDGGRPIRIKESELKAAAQKDFISFGSTSCENLTCVRDADYARDGGVVDLDAGAFGYCSDKCLEGSTCTSFDPNDDNDAKRRLNCRALLLDSETLKALCAAGACLPGNIQSPFFCARGGVTPDSGI